jgi:hypothetical protein
MKGSITATDGVKALPKSLRFATRLKIIYLFILPLIAMSAYDIMYAGGSWWTLVFCFVALMQVGFSLNNMRISQNILLLWFFVLGVPMQTILAGLWYDWSPATTLTHLYIFEVLGMCIGLFMGSIFRVAPITLMHRIASVFLSAVFILSVYFRFQKVFDQYVNSTEWYAWGFLLLPAITAAIPFIGIFVLAKDGNGINMDTSPLVDKLSGAMALAIVLYLFLPSILRHFYAIEV